ncbi:hypothetical protein PISL3812_07742 [Talaromyces islandicus]|uniref:Uncharacterized protein n=1 Tax=Talaromyces islandicus TaxID=28573 RepID=A0A0U1M574_TALIS|nr:hypothetical protein PISL3812_07742 [Talaromyces islandicus]
MVKENVAIALIIIILFIVLALVGFGIYALQNHAVLLLQDIKMLRLVRGASFVPATKRRTPLSRILLVHISATTSLTEDLKMYPDETAIGADPNSSAWLAQKMGVCIEKAKMCTPCPYPTTYVPDVGRLTREEYAELVLHFQDRLKILWEKVWFGLYKVHDSKGPTHASQLRKLYMGAGMAELMNTGNGASAERQDETTLQSLLFNALFENREKQPVIETLRLYDGVALDNLQYLITLLKEYEGQVEALSSLYQFLRQHQVDGLPTKDHPRISLDAQMQVLQMDMENEARAIHGGLHQVNTLLVKDDVLSS